MTLSYEKWPCPQNPGYKGYEACPGDGPNHTHCTACHRLYLGYVTLCPMHQATEDLLQAAMDVWESIPSSSDPADETVVRHAKALLRLSVVIARAKGEEVGS